MFSFVKYYIHSFFSSLHTVYQRVPCDFPGAVFLPQLVCYLAPLRKSKSIILECRFPGGMFTIVYVSGKIFRYIAIKQHTENILLEVPTVYAPTQVVGNIPYSAVQFGTFLFLFFHQSFSSSGDNNFLCAILSRVSASIVWIFCSNSFFGRKANPVCGRAHQLSYASAVQHKQSPCQTLK